MDNTNYQNYSETRNTNWIDYMKYLNTSCVSEFRKNMILSNIILLFVFSMGAYANQAHAAQVITKSVYSLAFPEAFALGPDSLNDSTGFYLQDSGGINSVGGASGWFGSGPTLSDFESTWFGKGPYLDSGRSTYGNNEFLFNLVRDTLSDGRVVLVYSCFTLQYGNGFILVSQFFESKKETMLPILESALATFEFKQNTLTRMSSMRVKDTRTMRFKRSLSHDILGRLKLERRSSW